MRLETKLVSARYTCRFLHQCICDQNEGSFRVAEMKIRHAYLIGNKGFISFRPETKRHASMKNRNELMPA